MRPPLYPSMPATPRQTLRAELVLLVITAMYLRALDPLPQGAHGFERFSKGVGVIALLAGAAYLLGALAGSRDVLQPLSALRIGAHAIEAAPIAFQRIEDLAALEQSVHAARGTPVMLDFYADWCVTCKEMERYTFSDPAVRARLDRMVKLQADVTQGKKADAALLKRFRLFGPPGIVFFDRQGREIPGMRVVGFQSAEGFALVLDRVLAQP